MTSTTFILTGSPPPQLAIYGEIDQRQITVVFGQFQPNPERPDVFGLQWSLYK
jgi:hypothetical protein